MQEEISLREIIETIWNGKIIIAGVTIIAMLLAAVYSFFMITPTYETTSNVRINFEDTTNQHPRINSLAEVTKSDVSLNKVIEQLDLDRNQYSISSLRNNIGIETLKDTNVVKLSMKGTNSDHITKIVNLLAFQLGARTEITERSEKIVMYQTRLRELKDSIVMIEGEILAAETQLEQIPMTITTKKSLSEDPYMQSVVQEQQSGSSSKATGALELIHEEVNPVYTNLQNILATALVSLGRAQEEQKAIEANITEHQAKIVEIEQQINNDRLKITNSERLLNGFTAVFVSPAIEPTDPVGPNKKLNIAIAMVVGLMLSLMYVFIRYYWQASGNTVKNSNINQSM